MQGENGQTVVGIVGAMAEEIALLKDKIVDYAEVEKSGMSFGVGTIKNLRVVVAQAGVGKVNAALTTTRLIDLFEPSAVLFTGVAGGLLPHAKIGDLVIATHTVQHDYDISVFRGQKGYVPRPDRQTSKDGDILDHVEQHLGLEARNRLEGEQLTPTDATLRTLAFHALDQLRAKGIEIPASYAGIVASGDQFIDDAARRQTIQRDFGAVCTEMEGAASAFACAISDVPFLAIRSISDCADGEAPDDFKAFLDRAANVSCTLIVEILRLMSETLQSGLEQEHKWCLGDDCTVDDAKKAISSAVLYHEDCEIVRWVRTKIRDVYFDTEDCALAESGAVLRIRNENGRSFVIYKLPGDKTGSVFRRMEFSREIAIDPANVSAGTTVHALLQYSISDQDVQRLASGIGVSAVDIWNCIPSLVVNNDRQAAILRLWHGSRVATYVDDYSFAAVTGESDSCKRKEVELEVIDYPLHHGDGTYLSGLVHRIVDNLDVKPSLASKYVIGVKELQLMAK